MQAPSLGRLLPSLALLLASLGACTGGGHSVGEPCAIAADCDDSLQCRDHVCVPLCRHHVDCGDGYLCAEASCVKVVSELGAACDSELDCGPGQTCRLGEALADPPGRCEPQTQAAIPGDECVLDSDCRAGACGLGHCVDLCSQDHDCARSWRCAGVPRLTPDATAFLGHFQACLPTSGTLTFSLPLDPSSQEPEVKIPVPTNAVSMTIVTAIDEPGRSIGATKLLSPSGDALYVLPRSREEFYRNPVRHEPLPGASVLSVPGSPTLEIEPGAYTLAVSAFAMGVGVPSARRRLVVVEKLGPGATLDLHFRFGDVADHPCNATIGPDLSAENAQIATSGFQSEFLPELRRILQHANIAVGQVTYGPVLAHPELASIDATTARQLFQLATATTGISIFFVRSIAPAGTQLLTAGGPGAPIPRTAASGVALSLDTLCYRSWQHLARQGAHAIARHLGLFRNVEIDGATDPIRDSGTGAGNLMHYSESGGTNLSIGQRQVLRLSPVLQ